MSLFWFTLRLAISSSDMSAVAILRLEEDEKVHRPSRRMDAPRRIAPVARHGRSQPDPRRWTAAEVVLTMLHDMLSDKNASSYGSIAAKHR